MARMARPEARAAGDDTPVELEFHAATADRWPDLERLFGERGACGGCWCQAWRRPRREFEAGKGAANRAELKRIIESGAEPGVIAYHLGQPVGWCSVAPREQFPVLENSRVLKRIDGRAVWSITCVFVSKRLRGRGVQTALLRAAVGHVRAHGGKVVEGYPQEPRQGRIPDAFAWTGVLRAFLAAGFSECPRHSPTRPIVRCEVR